MKNTRLMRLLGTTVVLASLLAVAQPALAADESCDPYDVVVVIDIRPCKDPNVLNVKVPGWLPVCIDVNEGVEVSDVALEGVDADVVKWNNDLQCLLAKFDAPAVIATLGTVHNGQVVTLTLTGEMVETGESICGQDQVTIMKRGGGR